MHNVMHLKSSLRHKAASIWLIVLITSLAIMLLVFPNALTLWKLIQQMVPRNVLDAVMFKFLSSKVLVLLERFNVQTNLPVILMLSYVLNLLTMP